MKVLQNSTNSLFSERFSTEKKLLFLSIGVFIFAFICFFALRNIIYSFISYNGKGTNVITLNQGDMDILKESNYFRDQCNFKNIIECHVIGEGFKTELGSNYLLFIFDKESLLSIPEPFRKNAVIVYAENNKLIIDKDFVFDGLLRKIFNDPYGNIFANFYNEHRFSPLYITEEHEGAYSRIMYFVPKL